MLTTRLQRVKCEVRNVQFTEKGKERFLGLGAVTVKITVIWACDSVLPAINLATFQGYIFSPFPG